VGVTREKRIQYARELLEKNFLPHVSISPGCQTAKVPSLLLIVGIDPLYRHLNARPSLDEHQLAGVACSIKSRNRVQQGGLLLFFEYLYQEHVHI